MCVCVGVCVGVCVRVCVCVHEDVSLYFDRGSGEWKEVKKVLGRTG